MFRSLIGGVVREAVGMVCGVSVLMFSGCAVIPVPEGNPFAGKVGVADSRAVIRRGVTRREEVVKVLGEPTFRRAGNTVWDYHAFKVKGIWLFLAPIHGGPVQIDSNVYDLWLKFDDAGVVRNAATFNEMDIEGAPVFSPDAKRVAYAARRGSRWVMVVDARTSEPFDEIVEGSLSFDSDGEIGYVAKRDGVRVHSHEPDER